MNTKHRIHLSVFLLAVLVSVVFFSMNVIERDEVIYSSGVFFIFGEISLLVSRFYQKLAGHGSGRDSNGGSGVFGRLPK